MMLYTENPAIQWLAFTCITFRMAQNRCWNKHCHMILFYLLTASLVDKLTL